MVTINLSAAGAKEAVARLREFLATDGISLKQTHAYEALALTLGYPNWNTLQALLSATPLTESEASPAVTALADKQTVRTDESSMKAQRALENGGRKPKLSRSLEQSLHRAIGLASERHHEYATLEHLLLSFTDDQDAALVLQACHLDIEQLRKELTEFIDSKLEQLVTTVPGAAKPTTSFQHVVQRAAVLHTYNSGHDEVTSAHVVVALFSHPESRAVHFLQQQGMTKLDAVSYMAHGLATPDHDREPALRRFIDSLMKGQPDFRDISPPLARSIKKDWPKFQKLLQGAGALQSLKFTNADGKMDMYTATFENRQLTFGIGPLGSEHQIAGLIVRTSP